jgi:acyl homoserine lactone synthase
MMYMIEADRFGEFTQEIAEMHRLRYRVFKQRLNWDVTVSGDMEIDEYDALRPVYLLHRSAAGHVEGCIRLLPTTGPYMLRNSFPALLGPDPAPESPSIWEISRFSLDINAAARKTPRGVSTPTFELLAALLEFGLARRVQRFVSVTDPRMERILRRLEWPSQRMCQPQAMGNSLAVAGFVDVSAKLLNHIRSLGGLRGPVLWEPVRWKETA